ncbi:uncharacterized protein LOC119688036 [Teleopsis dalmanni]|uniref:uncharacterized protein LOC119688036 n=1 Tax=Teleopsis dalmanni TaxID=139649 RepID=UPI0018CE96AB|nr:uncharacterized protein LOC119688036 [Teleopsis dalmanni]
MSTFKLKKLSSYILVDGSSKQLHHITSDSSVAEKQPLINSERLFVVDRKSCLRFLVDPSSVVSVVPRHLVKFKTTQEELQLYAANRTLITTFGNNTMKLDLGLRRSFRWQFIIADVEVAIIGANFLNHFHLLVDLRNKQLIDMTTKLNTRGDLSASPPSTISTIDETAKFSNLLKEFVDITRPVLKQSLHDTQKHGVTHQIETRGNIVFDRPRRLSGQKLDVVKAEITLLLDQGICRLSKSPWASPLHMVAKNNGGWRACGD